jgi:ABC-2 type transport system permease protein
MNKTWLIVKREYLSRVMKKSFLLVTLLTPIGFALVTFFASYLATSAGSSQKKAIVADQSGVVSKKSFGNGEIAFTLSTDSLENLKRTYSENGYDILVVIPPYTNLDSTEHQIKYYSQEKLSISTISNVEDEISNHFEDYKISKSQIDKATLDKLKINVKLENAMLSETDASIKGDKSSKFSSAISTGMAYLMGFLMYMVIFVFGAMVLRSVMEEKINRIIEVMVSTVKPFELMLGKVIGVGLVGLTQLLIWIFLSIVMFLILGPIIGGTGPEMNGEMAQAAEAIKESSNVVSQFTAEFKAMNWWKILPSFVIFFFGGYFIYSSMYAAVGSAVSEDMAEGQQLMLPIALPVIIAFIMIGGVIKDPDSPISIFASMFPLTSPIIMPARLPFEPPVWQIILSIVFLFMGVVLLTWLAGKIYRVGIFMYGKKVTFKELAKWVTYKG